MNNQAPEVSRWALKRPFRFVSSRSIDAVMHSLSQLEQNSLSHDRDISFLPTNDGYTFRYRIRRSRRNPSYDTIVAADTGRVWQDANGQVIVEGTAQIQDSLFYLSGMIALVIAAFYMMLNQRLVLVLPIIVLVAAGTIWNEYGKRDRILEEIEGAVLSNSSSLESDAAYALPEKAKNSRLSQDETVHPDSIWNEAISEHESENHQ